MPTAEQILVTGGTGFIGSFTAKALVDEGHDVSVLDLSTDTRILELLDVADEIDVHRGDITDLADVLAVARETGATRVVHLAALLVTACEERPRQAVDVNIRGTNNVLETARLLDDQIERVSWASTCLVYGPPEAYATDTVDEDDLIRPADNYAATKAYQETMADVYAERHGISTVAIRPTVAYGPFRATGGSAFLADLIERPVRGEPVRVGYGDQGFDWHYVKDIARAFALATLADDADLSRRVYNTAGDFGTIREVAAIVREVVPDADIEVTDEGEFPFTRHPDIGAVREDLGYEPAYDLEAGVRDYVDLVERAEDDA